MNLRGIWELKKIALRNLARHKVKTVITVLAVMISVAMYIVMDGVISGVSVASRRNIVNFDLGAAKLQTRQYFDKRDNLPSYESFTDWEVYRDILAAAGYNAVPRFVFAGTLLAPGGSAPIVFNAVDPEIEGSVLRYPDFIEFGRFIESGRFEMVLGIMAAERLRVGIPQRPLVTELNELADTVALDRGERDFIFSLYRPLEPGGGGLFAPVQEVLPGMERMALRADISRADLDRFWGMLERSGRNNVHVSTTIDIRGVPERISLVRWHGELMYLLGPEDRALMEEAYYYDEFLNAFMIRDEFYFDDEALERLLAAMLRVEFSGALRHVNQLFSAVVVGVVNSPDPATNGNVAFLPLDVMQGEEGMMLEGHVTELIIRQAGATEAMLPGRFESPAVITAALERGLAEMGRTMTPGLEVFSWMDYSEDYLGFEAMEKGATRVLVGLLMLLAFLGISNTILLAIMERTKEIGMMRAMGMSDGDMIQTYMLEAGFLGFFGSVLGVIVGCLLNYPLVVNGLDFSAMADALGGGMGFRVTSIMRSMWNVPVIIGAGIVATVVASLMAFIPTRRAVKMPITDSLRFE